MTENSALLPDNPQSPLSGTASEVSPRVLLVVLAVSGLLMAGFALHLAPLVALGVCGSLWLGTRYPQALLIAAIAWIPFTDSLSGGDQRAGISVAFGISDVLLLAALPGVIRAWLKLQSGKGEARLRGLTSPPAPLPDARSGSLGEGRIKAGLRGLRLEVSSGALSLPVCLYLAAGLLSFCLNMPAMEGATLSYLVGFGRTVQIVLVLPLIYAGVGWSASALGWMCGAYLGAVGLLALSGLTGIGTEGAYRIAALGTHKNVVGLALATGTLIALTLLSQANLRLSSRVRAALWCLGVFCPMAIGALMARSSLLCLAAGVLYLTWERRRLWLAAFAVYVGLCFFGALSLSPEVRGSLADAAAETASVRGRRQQLEKSVRTFQEHWLLGDGFRTRRDTHPHNLELTLLAENGLVGFVLFMGVLAAQWRLFRYAHRVFADDPARAAFCVGVTACWVAILVHAQFDPFWRRGPLWLPWAGTGILLAWLANQKNPGENGERGHSGTDVAPYGERRQEGLPSG
jgi:O-antigen ligase